MKLIPIALILGLAVSLSACQKKEDVKVVKTERVVVVKPSLESLDHRVTVLEEARVRANAKVKKFTPAPKYDPNYKG